MVVVGAGPSGVLASIYLAQQHYDVDVRPCLVLTMAWDSLSPAACTDRPRDMLYMACGQIYEQRARPDPVHRNLDRSYHLAMSHRGMGAVEKVSLQAPTQPWLLMRGGPQGACVEGTARLCTCMHACLQVGVDMSRFRAFPYRGSLLRFQSGAVQEVFHQPMSAKVEPPASHL